MTRKNKMTIAQLSENIFDMIAGTGYAHRATTEMYEFLEGKNTELKWDTGLIRIIDEDTDQELYKITITKTETL